MAALFSMELSRVNGQFASPSAFSGWQRGLMSSDDANWHALPNAAGTRDAWMTTGKWVGPTR
jgi:hypothetical protein